MAPKKVTNAELQKMVEALIERVDVLESKLASSADRRRGASINKVETFNGEGEAEPTGGLKMGYADKIVSMRNAIKILNPKLIVNGRHSPHNVAAVCGFPVNHEMMEDAYALLEKG